MITMSEVIWNHIDEKKPTHGQAVFYYFGVFNQVYAGWYADGEEEEEAFSCNIFYSKRGYLGDDVTWWAEREELPEGVTFDPTPPTDEQKRNCKYHPYPREV